MKAKDYLNQIQLMDIKIDQRIEELKEMRERISVLTGIDYSKDRIQATPTTGNKQIEELVDFERTVLDMINHETRLKHKVIGEIQQLNNPIYVDLLYKRYVKYQDLQDIAEDTKYTYNYICTIHGDALNEFQNKVLNKS